MHTIWETSTEEILCYIHDDFHLLERGWDTRVEEIFRADPRCGFVGFGGATGYGSCDIYKAPYALHQLNRQDFWSNMEAAETHGRRTSVDMPIVYADGYALAVRRSLLDKIGGWSGIFRFPHHGYDAYLACMSRRHGYTAWLAACRVAHGEGGWGAGAREHPLYKQVAAAHGGDVALHAAVHRFIYDEFRDVLPVRLSGRST
jgi:hypothetical protein